MRVFIETIDEKEVKKFITSKYESTGHDCWGNNEGYSYDVIRIEGKEETIRKGEYIAHNGEKALCVGFISYLPNEISDFLDPKLKEERKSKRYKEYLKLKKEFEVKSDENTMIIRDVNLEEIIE